MSCRLHIDGTRRVNDDDMYVSILLSLQRIDIHSSYLGLLVNLQSTRPMPTLSTIDIDSLEKPCLGATQQVGRWRGGGTALLHLVLEEELGSVAGHSQTRSVVEWIEPAWSRQASALNFRWMTCFPLPSHDVLTNHNCQCQSVCLSVRGRKKKGKRKLKAGVWTESLMFASVFYLLHSPTYTSITRT